MGNGVYLHPWDLHELSSRGGLAGLRDLGFGDAALAVAYHAGRWLTPHGGRLVRFLEDGVVHFRPAADYGVLQPRPSSEVPAAGASPLETFCREASGAGVATAAWTVLFHNSRLGRAHPESCVRNAFGDVYDYALCPARPEVREYGLTLIRDIARHDGLDTVELEAAGFMGHRHGSHHDKSSYATAAYTDFLLSYCLCDRCVAGLAEHGAGGDEVRERFRVLLQRALIDGDAMEAADAGDARARLAADLGESTFEAALAHRRAINTDFLRAVRGAVPAATRIGLHVQPDPLFTGSQMGQPLSVVQDLVDEIIVTHYGESPDRIARAWEGQSVGDGAAVRLAIWPKAPQFAGEADLQQVAGLARAKGCGGLRIYHAGLLPRRTLERVAAALG